MAAIMRKTENGYIVSGCSSEADAESVGLFFRSEGYFAESSESGEGELRQHEVYLSDALELADARRYAAALGFAFLELVEQ